MLALFLFGCAMAQLPPNPARFDTYTYNNEVGFFYWKSWKLDLFHVTPDNGMDARLVDNVHKDGEIDINIIPVDSKRTLTGQISVLRKDLRRKGFDLGNIVDAPTNYKIDKSVYFSRVEVYECRHQKKRYDREFWLAVMINDRYYYVISMITPARDNHFINWARNIEAFGVVIESFHEK